MINPGASKRIQLDIDLMNNEKDNTYKYLYDETDLFTGYLIMKGPDGTPYELGFYLIKFEFPDMYPFKPPICTYYNLSKPEETGYPTIRQSPNFHDDGKVCLSRLNTWDSTDQWLPCYNIRTIITSFQGLVFVSNSCDNEPPYNHSMNDPNQALAYDEIIRFANYKYNVNGIASTNSWLDEVLPESVLSALHSYVHNEVQRDLSNYLAKLNELAECMEGRYFRYRFYNNSEVICNYVEEIERFHSIFME